MPDSEIFYIPQILFLIIGSILFGIFLHAFHKQILSEGWRVSPRTVWVSCLCCSSLLFVIFQFDAYCVFGLYGASESLFLAWFSTAFVIDSAACALYMYVVIFYRQHMSGVPVMLTRVWVCSNVFNTFAIGLTAFVGSVTDNIFWYGLAGIFTLLQEVMVIIVLNISLHLVMLVLWKLRTPDEDFHGALRKMWICRILTTVLGLVAIVNQLIGTDDGLRRLNKWGVPLTLPPLDALIVIPDVIVILVHLVFLYSMTRPKESNNNTVVRIRASQTAELSESQTSGQSQA